jgi:hypothetical protein
MRMDSAQKGQKVSVIADMKTRKTITLMHSQKMYMLNDMPATGKDKTAAKGDVKFVKTGKTEKILGRACEEWLYTFKQGKSSVWLAKGMGTFAGLMDGKNLSQDAWVKMAESKGLFPLKTVTETKGGKTMTMMATDIQEKTLGAGLFEPPADYKKMGMPKVDMGEALKKNIPGVKLPF